MDGGELGYARIFIKLCSNNPSVRAILMLVKGREFISNKVCPRPASDRPGGVYDMFSLGDHKDPLKSIIYIDGMHPQWSIRESFDKRNQAFSIISRSSYFHYST